MKMENPNTGEEQHSKNSKLGADKLRLLYQSHLHASPAHQVNPRA